MLIVRNQTKTTTCECVAYVVIKQENKWEIKGKLPDCVISLGIYRTKKRCLEIMSEMDKALEYQMSKCNTRVVDENGHTIKNEYTNHYFKIYYMPKK